MLSPDDIELPLAGWTEIAPAGPTRRWRNSAGDQFSVDFFAVAPDLPAPLEDIDPLRRLYRQMLGDVGGLVEVEAMALAGLPVVRAIFKVPQSPSGMTYLGALTIPFRDCSFVLKWQCREQGTTGIRDAAVFAVISPPFDEETGRPQGWAEDPYERSHRGQGLRNRSDDEAWDPQFPAHPLSRLRSYLRALTSIRFSRPVLEEPPFVGPVRATHEGPPAKTR
jgi:hypothetical protein